MSNEPHSPERGLIVRRLTQRVWSSEGGTTLIELMIAMGLLMVIAAVALGSITLAENQQANTYARTASISQAQLIAEAVTRAVRNANNATVSTDTPIIEASPYELYFYQQSYSNPANNRISVIWLAGGTVSASAPPTLFETSSPGCSPATPCSVQESIYTSPTSSAYPVAYPPTVTGGFILFESRNLGNGIVFSNSSPTTTTNSCSSAVFSAGGSISTSIATGIGIFQFYDGCLNSTSSLLDLQTIGVTLQAQYEVGKPLVSVTSYVQIRNLGIGS